MVSCYLRVFFPIHYSGDVCKGICHKDFRFGLDFTEVVKKSLYLIFISLNCCYVLTIYGMSTLVDISIRIGMVERHD